MRLLTPNATLLAFMFLAPSRAFVPSHVKTSRSIPVTVTNKSPSLNPTTTSLFAMPWDTKEPNANSQPSQDNVMSRFCKTLSASMVALTLSFSIMAPPTSPLSTIAPANAADGKAIGLCLLQKCRLPLAKCITNPKCLANVICINTCNGKEDETGCQIQCGDIFENDVVGEFNKCAVSDMDCVPTRPDDGSYPIPDESAVVSKFDTGLWNGRWYITAGQNELFDRFPCQVHFFTETAPGKFFGKLNWRIQEPDGEFFTRDALQRFVQDPNQPGHLANKDNEYLHYQDDWYIIDYEEDGNKNGVPPFAFVYYRGANDAWVGYGGAVVYTRDSKLPSELIPRLREAAKKVNFDYDKDFAATDNTCTAMSDGEALLLKEKFAGKVALQTEEQLQAEAVRVRGNAVNGAKAQALLLNNEISQAEKAFGKLEKQVLEFEKEVVKDANDLEKGLVNEVKVLEKVVEDDVKVVEKEVVEVEKELFGAFRKK